MHDPFQSHQALGATAPFVNPYINPTFPGIGISPVGQINPGIYGIHPQTQIGFQQPGIPQLQNPLLMAALQNPLFAGAWQNPMQNPMQNPLVMQLLQAQHGFGQQYPGVSQQGPYGQTGLFGSPFAQTGNPYALAPQTALGPSAWLGQGYGASNPFQQLAYRGFQTSPWSCL
jgi:hypothetical protein